MTAEELEFLESCADEKSLESELAMVRLQIRRIAAYQMRDDISVVQKAKLAPVIISALRAAAYLLRQIAETEEPIDWDAVLDEVGEALDWDI